MGMTEYINDHLKILRELIKNVIISIYKYKILLKQKNSKINPSRDNLIRLFFLKRFI